MPTRITQKVRASCSLHKHLLTLSVFVRVHMLYINTEVNGHPVKAFVDSGAQATIMSPDCANKCGIMRLIDTRYAGIARGVGTAKILGRVHHAEIKIGGAVMPCAFTVMEGKDVDLLFGLDMLKRYKAKIDLEKNALCFEGIEVPFLHESEIPVEFEEAASNEPKVSGPNGTQVGTETGKVYAEGSKPGKSSIAVGAPAPPPPAPVQSQAGPSAQFPQEKIDELVSLGISAQAATQALQAAGGDVQLAASLLFGNDS
jgi:DNA damage-inducible protein 1